MNIFTTLFYQPILNLLVWLHNFIPGNDFGWSIVALTVLIKIILWPLSGKSLKSQKALQDLQPKVDALKTQYKDNKEALGRAMMDLYKAEKVSPFSSCLPLLVQFPFLIAIYQVLNDGLQNGSLDKLYSFVARPEAVNMVFLGIFDLSKASIILALVSGAFQFWQTKMLIHKPQPAIPGAKDENMASMMNKQMLYVMPILTVVIGATLPGGLVLYWLMNTIVTLIQQIIVLKRHASTT
ncbi:MAG: YidC/Oxa1 family membrane protein insertase [Patescibacteria group bacterium]